MKATRSIRLETDNGAYVGDIREGALHLLGGTILKIEDVRNVLAEMEKECSGKQE